MADILNITDASGVQLTGKGWAYCDAQKRKEIRERAQEHLALAELHQDAAQAYIGLLDHFTPDPEAEDGGDDEPALGWPNAGQPINERMATDDDRELEQSDWEPSLAAPESGCPLPGYRMDGDPVSWLGGKRGGMVTRTSETRQTNWCNGSDNDGEENITDDPHDSDHLEA